MDISASSISAGNTIPDPRQTVEKSNTLDYSAFLKLLITQFKNQDPTAPMDPTEQLSQLASFSQVEQQVKSNAKLDSLLTAFALSQADSVIGRTVTSADGDTTGKVMGVRIIDGGAVAVLANGSEIELTSGVLIT